jgi:hypothetical protein
MKSKNIQYPETSIQDQSILAMAFISTAKFEYRILCTYRVNYAPMALPSAFHHIGGGVVLCDGNCDSPAMLICNGRRGSCAR